jgi:sterol desaturase/sphingolipid hydroxylase (fatty acid hydroxylase superfamily)
MLAIVFVCGAPFGALLLRQTGQTLTNILAHTSFRLPPLAARIFGWVFITPNLHHVHHHFKQPYTDRNFGDTFSIWDRLFGTFAEPFAENSIFGLDTHMKEQMSGYQLVMLPYFLVMTSSSRPQENNPIYEIGAAIAAFADTNAANLEHAAQEVA